MMIENFQLPSFWCVTVALPFTRNNILKKKNNYGNSNISPCKNVIFRKKNLVKETKFFQDITNSIINPKFQHKPKYHLSKIFA